MQATRRTRRPAGTNVNLRYGFARKNPHPTRTKSVDFPNKHRPKSRSKSSSATGKCPENLHQNGAECCTSYRSGSITIKYGKSTKNTQKGRRARRFDRFLAVVGGIQSVPPAPQEQHLCREALFMRNELQRCELTAPTNPARFLEVQVPRCRSYGAWETFSVFAATNRALLRSVSGRHLFHRKQRGTVRLFFPV